MKFLNHAVRFVFCWLVIAAIAVALLPSVVIGDEGKVDAELIARQPWLTDRPETEGVVGSIEEVPPIERFWGYEFTPIVITWYGKHVRKFKHELQPFRAFGAQADSAEVSQQCEDKIDEVEKALKKSVRLYKSKEFAFVVVCLGRYIVKVVEEEEEK